MTRILFILVMLSWLLACDGRENGVIVRGNTARGNESPSLSNSVPGLSGNEIVPGSSNRNDTDLIRCGSQRFSVRVETRTTSKAVVVTREEKEIKSIILPTQEEINGFSLNYARPTETGFEISIEYGSRFYYSKDFRFNCISEELLLTEMKINSFDKRDPEATWKDETVSVIPKIPLKEFSIGRFITSK